MRSSQPPAFSPPDLVGLLVVTARLVQGQVAARLGPLNISYAKAVALACLHRSPRGVVAQSDIIHSLAVSRASGTVVLGDLQEQGLITRGQDPADARRQLVSLTAAGRALEEPVRDAFDAVEQVIRGSLEPHEVEASLDALRRMLDEVSRLRHGRGS